MLAAKLLDLQLLELLLKAICGWKVKSQNKPKYNMMFNNIKILSDNHPLRKLLKEMQKVSPFSN